jgi:hypothetical protein
VPAFPTVAYCQKKRHSGNDFHRLTDFWRRVWGSSLLHSNTETS